jgi:hypothetical protein
MEALNLAAAIVQLCLIAQLYHRSATRHPTPAPTPTPSSAAADRGTP